MASKAITFDPFIDALGDAEQGTAAICKSALYEGAGAVADELKSRIQALPEYTSSSEKPKGVTKYEKTALRTHMGISSMKEQDGGYYAVIGFAGYDGRISAKYSRGHPVAMIARSVESGTSWLTKSPFIKPAYTASKDKANSKMAEKVTKELKKYI